MVLASPMVSVRRSFGLTSKILNKNKRTELLNQSWRFSKSIASRKETPDQAPARSMFAEPSWMSIISEATQTREQQWKGQCSPNVPSLSLQPDSSSPWSAGPEQNLLWLSVMSGADWLLPGGSMQMQKHGLCLCSSTYSQSIYCIPITCFHLDTKDIWTRPDSLCPSFIPVAVTKYPHKSNFERKRFI